jgi:hypothetical protein
MVSYIIIFHSCISSVKWTVGSWQSRQKGYSVSFFFFVSHVRRRLRPVRSSYQALLLFYKIYLM